VHLRVGGDLQCRLFKLISIYSKVLGGYDSGVCDSISPRSVFLRPLGAGARADVVGPDVGLVRSRDAGPKGEHCRCTRGTVGHVVGNVHQCTGPHNVQRERDLSHTLWGKCISALPPVPPPQWGECADRALPRVRPSQSVRSRDGGVSRCRFK
jgi:hypothetical protein